MRLLVVEDYAPLRASLIRALTGVGHAVDATGDGDEAVWFLDLNSYDLVVLDLMLPKRSGQEILTHLRQRDGETAVLILSARDTVADQVQGLDLGADDYMTKPFAVDELLARVRSLLRRRHAHRTPVLAWRSLRLDTVARRLCVQDRPVDLSGREYALFEYLALRLDQMVTRAELWEHLYDFNTEVTSNVIDQWVARIRRKIVASGGDDPIETVRGQGYRFRDPAPA